MNPWETNTSNVQSSQTACPQNTLLQAQENPHGYMVAGAPGSQPADSYSSGTQQYDQQAIGHLPQQFGQQSQQQPEQLDLDKERREGTLSYDHLRNQHRQRFAMAD